MTLCIKRMWRKFDRSSACLPCFASQVNVVGLICHTDDLWRHVCEGHVSVAVVFMMSFEFERFCL